MKFFIRPFFFIDSHPEVGSNLCQPLIHNDLESAQRDRGGHHLFCPDVIDITQSAHLLNQGTRPGPPAQWMVDPCYTRRLRSFSNCWIIAIRSSSSSFFMARSSNEPHQWPSRVDGQTAKIILEGEGESTNAGGGDWQWHSPTSPSSVAPVYSQN